MKRRTLLRGPIESAWRFFSQPPWTDSRRSGKCLFRPGLRTRKYHVRVYQMLVRFSGGTYILSPCLTSNAE
jgi:hypothetical protein